ncbi:MAG: isoleucine--tRNA ligase, partial [Chloroflexi bacterium]|nr:isoleucine--tRNA ligase [Chloroflexota bacterium]
PEGLAVASDRGITVAIDAVITPELRDEGLVRDLVRYVQTLRKDVDYDLDQRIAVGLFGLSDEARGAVERFRDYLTAETLATDVLLEDDGQDWDGRTEEKLAGDRVELAVRAA